MLEAGANRLTLREGFGGDVRLPDRSVVVLPLRTVRGLVSRVLMLECLRVGLLHPPKPTHTGIGALSTCGVADVYKNFGLIPLVVVSFTDAPTSPARSRPWQRLRPSGLDDVREACLAYCSTADW